jgi:hypothetical protein
MKAKYETCIGTDIVVIGRDPEMADVDNPRGNIHGYAAYVMISDVSGRRWVHTKTYTNRWENEARLAAAPFLHAVDTHINSGQDVRLEFWREVDPVYGSDAYQAQGTEQATIQWEREQF